MSQLRDPEIKLFGKTITSCVPRYDHHSYSHDDKITSEGEFAQSMHEDDLNNPTADESVEPETSSGLSDDPKMQDADTETLSPKSMKAEDPNQEKTLKKPDKIIPCPRCNSMETKFCYYNNYNVSQPRHFCKNCQRYWTAGGTMRNVPVGSGRRKNKSSSTSNYRHIMISDALQAARVEAEHGMHLPAFKANGTVLTFGSDKPLCDSMASVLNLDEKSQNCAANGFHGSELRMPANGGRKEFGNDQSSGPCSTASNVTEIGNNSGPHDLAWKKFQAFPPQVPYFPGAPWPCTWDGFQWRSVVPPAAVAPSGFPVSFYPAPPYWGCAVASPWNVPWLSPTTPPSDQPAHVSSPTSPTLGKHSRDGSMLNPSHSERGDSMQQREEERHVLIPKTLRIDDPNEAAKSSIWSTLGITNEKYDSVSGARLFKAFNSKADDRNTEADTSLVLQANPAAMSRSFNFQEST